MMANLAVELLGNWLPGNLRLDVGPLRSESETAFTKLQPFPTDPSASTRYVFGWGWEKCFVSSCVCLCTAVSLDRGWSRTCRSDAKYATLNSRGQNQNIKNAIKQNKVALNKNKKIRATTQYRLHRCTGDSLLRCDHLSNFFQNWESHPTWKMISSKTATSKDDDFLLAKNRFFPTKSQVQLDGPKLKKNLLKFLFFSFYLVIPTENQVTPAVSEC